MSMALHGFALFLLLNVTAGLVRIARGPTAPDRMLAAQLFGTTGVAILLVLAEALDVRALRDVALVFALLAAVLAVAFVKRGRVSDHARRNRA
ncbi:MAG TPA: monovalent cation/H+ antiporter complex subunit F [Longimicrobiales bacterium]|nr:monovalent cation/H+ antiporter complex subunit F [Longimicrobiales bacterium]